MRLSVQTARRKKLRNYIFIFWFGVFYSTRESTSILRKSFSNGNRRPWRTVTLAGPQAKSSSAWRLYNLLSTHVVSHGYPGFLREYLAVETFMNFFPFPECVTFAWYAQHLFGGAKYVFVSLFCFVCIFVSLFAFGNVSTKMCARKREIILNNKCCLP